MTVPQLIVVSPRGSGTDLLAEATTALGYTSYGTMSAARPAGDEGPGAGEVYPLLLAAYGKAEAMRLLNRREVELDELNSAFQEAVRAVWRVWWTRLGQPVTAASPVDPLPEARLARVPDAGLPGLLPGRGCWYVNDLDLQRVDSGFLRAWHEGGQPPIILHQRDVRDRIISQIRLLTGPADRVGSLPDHLLYRDILLSLPTMDARIELALTDPDFPGMRDARHRHWLANHPAVTLVTHEELAGPAHGGTAQARREALARLLDATGHHGRTLDLPTPRAHGPEKEDADDLDIGVWRRYFTSRHERLALSHGSSPEPVSRPPEAAARPV